MKRIGFWNGQLRVDSYGSPRLNALRQLQKIDYSLLKELNEMTSLLGVNFLGEVLDGSSNPQPTFIRDVLADDAS